MEAFKTCLANSGLGHINTVGPLFTWNNMCQNDLIQKRLDRVLENKEWFNTFFNCVVLVKPRGLMDHNPLILNVPIELDKVPKPFQYFNFMCDLEGFHESVRVAWHEETWFGDPMAVFRVKNERRSKLP